MEHSKPAAKFPLPRSRSILFFFLFLGTWALLLILVIFDVMAATDTGRPGLNRDLSFVHPSTHNERNDLRVTTLSEHKPYESLSHDYDELWDQLLTPNGGFIIKIDDKNLRHRYGVSMFHQLHCLAMIRAALQMLEQPNTLPGNASHHEHQHEAQRSDFDMPHWLHCFDYLRQVTRSFPATAFCRIDCVDSYLSNSYLFGGRQFFARQMTQWNPRR